MHDIASPITSPARSLIVGRGRALLDHLNAQRGHMFGWVPVFFGIGVALYFGLSREPGLHLCLTACVTGVACVCGQRLCPETVRPLVVACALASFGFGAAGLRAHAVAEPVLGFRYYGPIEGRIIEIDRSQSDAVRLTLDQVVLQRMSPDRTPTQVRVSLHGEQGYVAPAPGQVVIMTGHLSPPSGPVEPGGFDFQRMAWFEGLGAVGYTRNPVLLGRAAERSDAALWIYSLRYRISSAVQEALPGATGPFAAAIMVGDRSAIAAPDMDALRATNLAHLLAISGMHMGILAAFVFASVRYGLALVPSWALRLPGKKVAALVALVAAVIYLGLSGGNVSTQRAFVQVAVMLGAVLMDRRALTLRAVAIAAMIVLLLRPEALFGPGFQMSFAATTALVVVFGALRHVDMYRVPKWARGALSVFISSLVAGLATAPIAAFHFNQVAQLGLVANLLCVPLMGILVMPAAVLAAVLAPLGLEIVGLWIMDIGLRWILFVAHTIAGFDVALRHVMTPGSEVLALICMGGLFVVNWRGVPRLLGALPILAGFALWQVAERPAVIIADSGSLIGVMGPEGRAVSKSRGESFAAGQWLENDGGPVPQDIAFERPGLEMEGRRVWTEVAGVQVLAVRGKVETDALTGCEGAAVLVTNQELEMPGCTVFDITSLRQSGAVAGWDRDGSLVWESVRDRTGDRLWNTARARREATSLRDLFAFSTAQ